jgi:hypothetical protein
MCVSVILIILLNIVTERPNTFPSSSRQTSLYLIIVEKETTQIGRIIEENTKNHNRCEMRKTILNRLASHVSYK